MTPEELKAMHAQATQKPLKVAEWGAVEGGSAESYHIYNDEKDGAHVASWLSPRPADGGHGAPSTAQPITRVRLTTHPNTENPVTPALMIGFTTSDGYRFDRVKCRTCDGQYSYMPCKDCRSTGHGDGTPPNEWTCLSWPLTTFEMPQASGVRPLYEMDLDFAVAR